MPLEFRSYRTDVKKTPPLFINILISDLPIFVNGGVEGRRGGEV